MMSENQVGERGFAAACGECEPGDREPLAHPERAVAGEHQVGQRVDHEIGRGMHESNQRHGGSTDTRRQFAELQARDQHVRQIVGCQGPQIRRHLRCQPRPQPPFTHRGGDP